MSYTLFDDSDFVDPKSDPPPKRERNPVWDALAEWFGEPATTTETRLRGRILKSLTGAGATAELVHERCTAWGQHFPGASLTPTALEKHWTQLGLPPLRELTDFTKRGHEGCPTCHGSGIVRMYSPSVGGYDTPCKGSL